MDRASELRIRRLGVRIGSGAPGLAIALSLCPNIWGLCPLFERAFVFWVQLGAYWRDQFVHQLRRLVLYLVVQVTVDVHDDAGFRVSQHLGHHNHRDAMVEHQRDRRVAQIMKTPSPRLRDIVARMMGYEVASYKRIRRL